MGSGQHRAQGHPEQGRPHQDRAWIRWWSHQRACHGAWWRSVAWKWHGGMPD